MMQQWLERWAENARGARRYLAVFFKWAVVAAACGAVCGAVGAAFYHAVALATSLRTAHPWLLFLLPAAGLAIVGLYHLAGEFCPAESVITVGLLNYERANVGGATTDDAIYLLTYTEAAGPCTTHTEANPGGTTNFNPLDPSTWPTDDPNFSIFDPSTWPTNDPEPQPSESGDPSVDPSPSPSGGGETPAPSPSPTASPSPSPSPSGGGESQPGASPSGTVPAN